MTEVDMEKVERGLYVVATALETIAASINNLADKLENAADRPVLPKLTWPAPGY